MRAQGRSDPRIELLRALGALSVFAYHFLGDAETILQGGLERNPVWIACRIGSGPFGVALFIIISGLVFTWSWERTGSALRFIHRRLSALFPLYWWIALPLTSLALVTHHMSTSEIWKIPIWLSGLGIVSRSTFFPVVDGWWYMTLALQLVLTYPLLRKWQDRLGILWFLVGCAAVTIASTWTLMWLGLNYANLGFIGSRLMEFAVGMTLGRCVGAKVRAWPPRVVLFAMVGASAACILGSPGTPTHLLLAPMVAVVTLGVTRDLSGRLGTFATAAGGLSFAFYLSHSPWAKPILSAVVGATPNAVALISAGALSLGAAALVAWGFQSSFDLAHGVCKRALSRSSDGIEV